jgi:curved DNA-binding protein CbpA
MANRRESIDIILAICEAVSAAGSDGISRNRLMERTAINWTQLKSYLKLLQGLIEERKIQIKGVWGRPPEKMIFGTPRLAEKIKIWRNFKEERDKVLNSVEVPSTT